MFETLESVVTPCPSTLKKAEVSPRQITPKSTIHLPTGSPALYKRLYIGNELMLDDLASFIELEHNAAII
jgi:iron-sulfur cluster repair protein YtfE (RIC family)